jgi:hypothetical protein
MLVDIANIINDYYGKNKMSYTIQTKCKCVSKHANSLSNFDLDIGHIDLYSYMLEEIQYRINDYYKEQISQYNRRRNLI